MSRAPLPNTAKGDAPMPSSFDDNLEFWDESRWGKLGRRLKEEPLIPLGLALTCYALYNAAKSMRSGDKEATNKYFRARLYAQGFTIVCVCVGAIYYKEDREKRKYYSGLLDEKRAKEKKDSWIRELEARDREDEEEREKRKLRKARMAELASKDAKGDEGTNASPLDVGSVQSLMLGSQILGPAMARWWRRD